MTMNTGHKPGGAFYLTPEVHKLVVASTRAGAYAHVAAQAAGLSMRTFNQYMADDAFDHYHADHHDALRAFQAEVRQAQAQARMAAEITVRTKKPFEWLRYGPGREKKDNPGWTDTSKVEVTGANGGPIAHAIAAVDLKALSDGDLDELERLSAKLSGGGAGSGESGESSA